MNRPLTHDEAFEQLDAVAFDAIDGTARDAVMAHVEGCEICRTELVELRATVTMIAFTAPPAVAAEEAGETRDRVRARLLARVSADAPAPELALDRSARPAASPAAAPERSVVTPIRSRRAEWMAIAAGILLAASLAGLAAVMRDRQNVRDALAAQIAQNRRAAAAGDSLRVALMTRDSIIAGLTGRDVAMMTLTSAGTKAPYAHMFWDKVRHTWTLVAHNMPELKPGRTYQLWLVTADQKISAGTFEPRDGDAMMRATYALADPLMALAVTEEPAGGMPQPTGAMVMVANAH
jgi:hypothetical protein